MKTKMLLCLLLAVCLVCGCALTGQTECKHDYTVFIRFPSKTGTRGYEQKQCLKCGDRKILRYGATPEADFYFSASAFGEEEPEVQSVLLDDGGKDRDIGISLGEAGGTVSFTPEEIANLKTDNIGQVTVIAGKIQLIFDIAAFTPLALDSETTFAIQIDPAAETQVTYRAINSQYNAIVGKFDCEITVKK